LHDVECLKPPPFSGATTRGCSRIRRNLEQRPGMPELFDRLRRVSVTISQLRSRIQVEYDALATRFGLAQLPLDVYEVDDSGNGGVTAHGTDRRNGTPGYTPTHVVLPMEPGDLAAWGLTQPAFPPTNWNRHTAAWPAWRTDLWHEVVHQYQHQDLKNWDPKDGGEGHSKGWPDAVRDVAASFGIAADELLRVL